MGWKILLVALLLVLQSCAGFLPARQIASSQNPEHEFSYLPKEGRRSLHGMVVFGAGPYFLEHIPMLSPPHDFQIIAEVSLSDENGKELMQDFSQSGFTLQPATKFSLNDYIAGRLREFSGSIHVGSFETGGKIVPGLKNINVSVKEYKFIRQIPAASDLQFLRVSDGKNLFESNVIRPEESFQRIRNANTDAELWCVKGPDFFDSCQ